MTWNKDGEISIRLKTDSESMIGLISKAEVQMEELLRTISRLKHCLSLEENTLPAMGAAGKVD